MKVLDLVCTHGHVFEGWFASEADFLSQRERALIECPFCGDASVAKKPSAPRLNLGSTDTTTPDSTRHQMMTGAAGVDAELQSAWLTLARRIIAQTDDVGQRFAEEARKIHYGESEARGIRGQASMAETQALIEEGISVLPLALPEALKGRVQ